MRDGHTFHLRFPFPFIMCRGRESVRQKGTRGFLVVGAPAEGPSPGASVEPDSFLLGRESLKLCEDLCWEGMGRAAARSLRSICRRVGWDPALCVEARIWLVGCVWRVAPQGPQQGAGSPCAGGRGGFQATLGRERGGLCKIKYFYSLVFIKWKKREAHGVLIL